MGVQECKSAVSESSETIIAKLAMRMIQIET